MGALVCHRLSGQRLEARSDPLYEPIDGVASGAVEEAEVPVFPRRISGDR